MKPGIVPTLLLAGTLAGNMHSSASTCYNIAVQKYNRGRATLNAPYNHASVIYKGRPEVKCTIEELYLGEYSLKIACNDGYKYEIGTTGYCGRSPQANCETAKVTNAKGIVSYHQVQETGQEEICDETGAKLMILSKIFGESEDILVITTHEFRQ